VTPSTGAAPIDHAPELAFATALAVQAGDLLVERFEKVQHIDYKSAKDVVTEVDRLSEELIIGAIRAAYPGDGIIAEESGEHVSGAGNAPSGGIGRAWVIDPLDGTINYANGIPFFCVAIALVEAGVPVVGVILDPIRGETFAATADGPATLAGREIRASVKSALTDYVVSMALSGRALGRPVTGDLQGRPRVPARWVRRRSRSRVGNGRFDAFVQQGGLSTWDARPPVSSPSAAAPI
jgi:myo-inositol-1(or 4)-monophosphatase